jgi:hypothetical protein
MTGTLELKENDWVVKWHDTTSLYYETPDSPIVFTHVCPHQQGFIHHLYNIGDEVDFRIRADRETINIYYRAIIKSLKKFKS